MVDVEMSVEDEDVVLPTLSLDALQYVKIAQTQHGMRHNDYARYRQYCTRKSQRLREKLKLRQGRGKYVKKKLELATVTSVGYKGGVYRHLQLPLVSAERSWAWAQESKAKMDTSHSSCVRQHTLRRLAKAAQHANSFALFALQRGTARTAVEAEAYAAHMSGLHLVEYPHRKAAALGKLQQAMKLCKTLARVGTFEQQAAAQQRVDEIEPVLRFVKYQLRQSGETAAEDAPQSTGGSVLQEKLAALEAESKDTSTGTANVPAGAPAYIQWRGNAYTVFGERLKTNIQQAALAVPALEEAQAGGNREEQQTALESLITAFNEAKGIVRHALATGGGRFWSRTSFVEIASGAGRDTTGKV